MAGQSEDAPEQLPGELRQALKHPVRRQILRSLHSHSQPLSTAELAKDWIDASQSEVSYHAKALLAAGALRVEAVRPPDGPADPSFTSAVADDPRVSALLAKREFEDTKYRRAEDDRS